MASGDQNSINTTSYTPAVPWARLKAWIEQKETWERQHAKPATLSEKELAALSTLMPLCVTPQFEDSNYVGALTEFSQAKSISLSYSDRSITWWVNGASKLMWQVFVTIRPIATFAPDVVDQFPREGYGLEPGSPQMLFDGKKQAKQYAAMCALKFLRQEGPPKSGAPMPNASTSQAAEPATRESVKRQAGKDPDFIGSSMKRSRNKLLGQTASVLAESQEAAGFVTSPSLLSPASSPSTSPRCSETTSMGDVLCGAKLTKGSPTADHQSKAHELATTMGLGPPKYIVEPDVDNPGFFSAFACLQPGNRVPSRLAFVRNASTKDEASNKVAEELHSWLEREWKRRMNLRSTFLKGIVAIDG